MKNKPTSFLLADDHPIVAVGLKEVLEQEFTTAKFYAARTGQEALAVLAQHPIDILFLDVSMPALDAYGAFPAIKKQYPATKVILYTQLIGRDMILHFLHQGVNAILFKGENDNICEVVEKVWATCKWIPRYVQELVEGQLFEAPVHKIPLGPKERSIILYVSQGKSSKEIAEVMHLGENTINSYRQELLKKTGTKNTDELIRYGYINGLIR
jgi:DNA-binding NarL/FixJ family response regulator